MKKAKWLKIVIPVFAAAIIAGIIGWMALSGKGLFSGTGIIAEAKYPESGYNPQMEETQSDNINAFFEDSTEVILAGTNGQNAIYSPLNVYMALSMLAEVTDGNSREQILDLLGSDNIEELRKQANAIWCEQYNDDEKSSTILANSIWLRDDCGYNEETLDLLAKKYYASSFEGKMGSTEYNKMLQNWLNSQTKEFLAERTCDVELSPDTIMALASTIYFKGKWNDEFNKEATKTDVFHGASGDTDAEFMNKREEGMYYWNEKYAAVRSYFAEQGSMWFILPDEGVSIDEILSEKKYMQMIRDEMEWKDQKYLIINEKIPKFDISAGLDLKESLSELGIKDVFDGNISDFTPLVTEESFVELTKIEHAARVAIDEEGVIAAAYTVEIAEGAAMPPDEEVDFILDRPFIFVITGKDNLPLFVGVVNNL